MAVHDGLHIGPHAVDFAVDIALEQGLRPLRIDRLAFEVVLHDVARGDRPRRDAAREEESFRIAVVPRAHVTEPVDHSFDEQDAVGRDQIPPPARRLVSSVAFMHPGRLNRLKINGKMAKNPPGSSQRPGDDRLQSSSRRPPAS